MPPGLTHRPGAGGILVLAPGLAQPCRATLPCLSGTSFMSPRGPDLLHPVQLLVMILTPCLGPAGHTSNNPSSCSALSTRATVSWEEGG